MALVSKWSFLKVYVMFLQVDGGHLFAKLNLQSYCGWTDGWVNKRAGDINAPTGIKLFSLS